jgi:hypothetical protein
MHQRIEGVYACYITEASENYKSHSFVLISRRSIMELSLFRSQGKLDRYQSAAPGQNR